MGQRWWSKQIEIAQALADRGRVLVQASHSIGKSHVAAGLALWHFDIFRPGLTITTANTLDQVKDVLWKEIRTQAPKHLKPHFAPAACRLFTAPDHFAVGYTATEASAFQGRHESRVLIIFDEATGIESQFWDAALSMLTGGGKECRFLAICNPTDTASRMYEECQNGDYEVISVSAMDHPNVQADLEGRPRPIPGAVTAEWIGQCVRQWCTQISNDDRQAGDVRWDDYWWRPGPEFESRVLGRWPSTENTGVWSEALWNACMEKKPMPDLPLEIGCDVARFGDDWTAVVARRGGCAIFHDRRSKQALDQTAGWLKELCGKYAKKGEDPRSVCVKIDADGLGSSLIDFKGGFNFVPIQASNKPIDARRYPNRRSELWFNTAEMARKNELDFTRLNKGSLTILRRQLMAPKWKVDSAGRRLVEKKEQTKQTIGGSPDDADALNLAFAAPSWAQDQTLRKFLLGYPV